MKRKLVSAILCGAMVLAMMTGCGSSGDAKGDKITINLYQNKSEMADQYRLQQKNIRKKTQMLRLTLKAFREMTTTPI